MFFFVFFICSQIRSFVFGLIYFSCNFFPFHFNIIPSLPSHQGKKRVPKKMDTSASLNVACLKRLLPIGLNMFGGKEQELVQQAKQKFVDVSLPVAFVFVLLFL